MYRVLSIAIALLAGCAAVGIIWPHAALVTAPERKSTSSREPDPYPEKALPLHRLRAEEDAQLAEYDVEDAVEEPDPLSPPADPEPTIKPAEPKQESENQPEPDLVPPPTPKPDPPPAPEVKEEGKIAYLTFDDGPSKNTERILDILKAENVQATFFVCANTTPFGMAMYQRMAAEGHAIGNHTYSHDYKTIYASEDNFMSDVERLQALIGDATGLRPTILRFPGGSNNQTSWQYGGKELMPSLTQRVLKEGFQYFDWNAYGHDAEGLLRSPSEIVQYVVSEARNRRSAVILLHDSMPKTTTVEALPEIIRQLRELGFTFAPLTPASYAPHF